MFRYLLFPVQNRLVIMYLAKTRTFGLYSWTKPWFVLTILMGTKFKRKWANAFWQQTMNDFLNVFALGVLFPPKVFLFMISEKYAVSGWKCWSIKGGKTSFTY
jgi:hypothetical protein